ncbi:hypothetical protein [Dactylosporangium sp. NPDC049140]|uniref:hypothetical protein n=1 Tax=Dactylosporangium sp. NPDC049140 TaxID=3155647 RepID=UPI0034082D47
MSTFHIGSVQSTNLVMGDHGTVIAGSDAALQALSREVDASAADIGRVGETIEALRAELARRPVDAERVRELMARLARHAATLNTVVEHFERIRDAPGTSR